MFIDSGDLRNALLTASKLPIHKSLNIHLADKNPIVTARNFLITHMILLSDFNPERDEDMEYLWHIWYSYTWGETTRQRFVKDLKK